MELVIAAIVTGAFGLLTIMVEKGRRENVKDHGFVKEKLDNLLVSINMWVVTQVRIRVRVRVRVSIRCTGT